MRAAQSEAAFEPGECVIAWVESEAFGSGIQRYKLIDAALAVNRWTRLGVVAGIGFAVVWIIAALLPGAPPHADGKANTYQNYLVEHQQSLVGQAWLYSLAAALI